MAQSLDKHKGQAPEDVEVNVSKCIWCSEDYYEHLSDSPSDTLFCSAECEENYDLYEVTNGEHR